jgi:hypothetical protein
LLIGHHGHSVSRSAVIKNWFETKPEALASGFFSKSSKTWLFSFNQSCGIGVAGLEFDTVATGNL